MTVQGITAPAQVCCAEDIVTCPPNMYSISEAAVIVAPLRGTSLALSMA